MSTKPRQRNAPIILIVDDVPQDIRIIAEFLKLQGYQLVFARNGKTALEQVEKQWEAARPIDLILLDVMMPDMDGFEVCSRLKASHSTSGIPIIFLTGKVDHKNIIHGFQVGAVDYVVKPFNREELLARIKTHLELKQAREEAEIADRMKTEFLNSISHELRTPLTVILGNIHLFLDIENLPEPDEIVEIAEDINKEGEHLLAIISDLLDLSKVEAGKLTLQLENISLDGFLTEIVMGVENLANQKGLELILETSATDIQGDPLRIKQILLNLLSNAIKFTTKGSIRVSTLKRQKEVEFCVSDTGCGIDTEDLRYIFDPFRQIDSSSTRTASGTGLGLTITKKLVEMHKGRIRVDSKKDEGSQFYFTIPVYQETEKE